MRDRNLTGPWAGFAFKGGRLVTPEGRELLPEDLAWLSLTAAIAQEWRSMMADRRRGADRGSRSEKPCGTRLSKGSVVAIRDYMHQSTKKRAAQGGPLERADKIPVGQPLPGPKPGKRG